MATLKQKLAAEYLLRNNGNVGAAMREAGYSEAMADNPQKLTRSVGFQELCEKAGLTDDFVLKALHDDIESKPRHRHNELALAIKVRGLERPAKTEHVNVNVSGTVEDFAKYDALKNEYEARLRDSLIDEQ